MNAPAGETRRPVTVNLEVEFEGFSGKERFPDALMYPKGVLLRTRYLKPVGTPASFVVLDQEGLPIGGRGQVVFSRWQDQGPRRPAGLGIRIDEWIGESEARVARWFEPASQFDLVDAQAVPAATAAAAAEPVVTEETGRSGVAPEASAPAEVAHEVEESAQPLASGASELPVTESAPPVSRWMAEDVPAAMPDLSARFGSSKEAPAAGSAGSFDMGVPEPAAPEAPVSPPLRPAWEPLPEPSPALPGGVETVRIPRGGGLDESFPRAGSHMTRQTDSGGESQEPFRPVWSPPAPQYPSGAAQVPVPPALSPPSPPSLNAEPAGDDLPVGREGNVVWLPPEKPRLLPWILAGVLAVAAAAGGYWVYSTRFAAKTPETTQADATALQATKAVEPPPAAPVSGPATGSPAAASPAVAGPASVQETPAPAAAPRAEPPGAAPPEKVDTVTRPDVATGRRFGSLSAVSWNAEGDELIVRLSLDGSVSAADVQQFRVSGPPAREVVKLRGCRPPVTRRHDVRDRRLSAIRLGEQPGGDLHVVLDLADGKVTVTPVAIDGATLILRLRR